MVKLGFFHSTKTWCVEFVEAFKQGAAKHGDIVEPVSLHSGFEPHWDAACILGIGYIETWDRVQAAPVPMCYLDKGYTRTGDYFYTSIGGYRPINYVGQWSKPDDRRKKFGWEPAPWREPTEDGHILIAGSSLKFHEFHRLPHPEQWRDDLVKDIRRYTKRRIKYRPKPNQPLGDVWFDLNGNWKSDIRRPLEADLTNCHVCITHGSSVALDAMLVGVPGIVLGSAITRPISDTTILWVGDPYLASMDERLALLNDLGYCQWSVTEYGDGTAWAVIKPELQKLIKR
jgi:hypothetical protein